MTVQRPLDGIRVISLAEQYPGPLATFQLAELGADVIQLERPGLGDPQRRMNPELFRASALNKRSIELDLKTAEGLESAKALIATADVLVEGYRPGVMARLGLGYDVLSADHPALVYCSISGYGQSGSNSATTGHNINYEAVVGGLDAYVRDEGPEYHEAELPFGDIMAGMTAALGIVAAVHHASRTGQGAYLDIAIADALLLALSPQLSRAASGAEVWTRREAAWGVFPCSSGHLVLGIAHEDHFWVELCSELGLLQLAPLEHDDRVSRAEELREVLRDALATDTAENWIKRLGKRSVPCSLVRTLDDVIAAPDMLERDMIVSAADSTGERHLAVRSPLSRPWADDLVYMVPDLGQHTAEVLRGIQPGTADG